MIHEFDHCWLTYFLIVTVMKLMKEKAYPAKTIIIKGKVLKYYDM